MTEALERIDTLIQTLQGILEEMRLHDVVIGDGGEPHKATFRIRTGTNSILYRKVRQGEVIQLAGGTIRLRSGDDVPRRSEISVTVQLDKNGEQETMLTVDAVVVQTKRISGAYEIHGEVRNLENHEISTKRRFLEYAQAGDAAGWNRWCADLAEGPVLRSLKLPRANLANFDLCCADLYGSDLRDANLSGCDLSGANLSECDLDRVTVTNADLFNARLPRVYMGLIVASGTVEAESIILV